jgi:hypothetical protein
MGAIGGIALGVVSAVYRGTFTDWAVIAAFGIVVTALAGTIGGALAGGLVGGAIGALWTVVRAFKP